MNVKTLLFLLNIGLFVSLNARELFIYFPELEKKLAHINLCDLPTPIEHLNSFGNQIGCANVYIKRDDLTGKKVDNNHRLYGGNKPRKLEFLLADAIYNHNATTIITYGCAGSNHALATAVYAYGLGLPAILMLKDQPNSSVVRQNLLLDNYYDAQLSWYPNNKERDSAAKKLLAQNPQCYLIPTGGSNCIGTIGFVNAAFELAKQIKTGSMPEPDLIYLATGSCATIAGLLLGIKTMGLTCHLVGVCVEPEGSHDAFLSRIQQLFTETNALLHDLDSSFPLFDFPAENLTLNKKFCGTEYGLYIPEAIIAINLFKETEQIILEGTYSAKPIAAIIDDAQAGLLDGKNVLFWNTYCGLDFSYLINNADYTKLPIVFQNYFEQEVQYLAKE